MGRPPRPVPPDFAEVYERLGWDAKEHYGARTDTFARWVADFGRERLRRRRRNYVMGNRLGFARPSAA